MKKNNNKNKIKHEINEAKIHVRTEDIGLEEVSIRFPYPVNVYRTNAEGILIQMIVDMMYHIKSLEDKIKNLK